MQNANRAGGRVPDRASPAVMPDGLAALQAGDMTTAAREAGRFVEAYPQAALAWLILGVARHQLGQAGALDTLAHAVSLAPQEAQFHYNYAVTLAEEGHDELAMVAYRACLDVDPDYRDALWNYGEMLRLREHFGRALACFDRLHRLEGRHRAKMHHRMAVCCAHLPEQAARADALFQAQIAEDDDAKTHWEYALFLLGQGRLDEAWPHYARRFDAGRDISVSRPGWPFPPWPGSWRAGTLLVYGEQGAGDEILFAAYLPGLLARARTVGLRVVLACRDALSSLFHASFPGLERIAQDPALAGRIAAGQGPVWQVALGDLPRHLPHPGPVAYLRPAETDRTDIAALLARLPQTGRPKVGLVWSANPTVTPANRQHRSIPAARLAAHLAEWQNMQLFSLQTVEHSAALAELADIEFVDLGPHLTDFSRTAAAMQAMDVVVSVCTSTANLAGALGVDTRVLLQYHADWRWHEGAAWFSRAVAYRQRRRGDWSGPLDALAADLVRWTASPSSSSPSKE